MLRGALVILVKDLRLRLRDRSVLLFALVVPFGLTLLFSFIFPQSTDFELTAAVVDLDQGEISAGFVDGVVPPLQDAGVVDLVALDSHDAARAQVAAGEIDAAWVFPAGFSDAVLGGREARVEVLVAAGQTLSGEVAQGIVNAFVASIDEVNLAIATASTVQETAPSPELIASMTQATAAGQPPAIGIEDLEVVAGEPMSPMSFLAAGMAAFFVFFTVQYGVTGLLEERQLGTMPRLQAAPIPPAAIQLGKVAGAFVLGIISVTVLIVASALLLGAQWGHPGGVAILVVAIVLAAMGVMSLVGSFARTAEQAGNYQSIVAVVLGMLGGVFFPIPADSGIMRLMTLLSPHGWFMRGMSELAATNVWTAVLPAAAAMVGFGVVAAIPAVLIQRRAQAW